MEGADKITDCKCDAPKSVTPYSPSLAAMLSFAIAGLGQVYNGQIGKGVLIFFSSFLVFPWLLGIVDAYKVAQRLNNGDPVGKPKMGVVIGVAIAMVSLMILVAVIAVIAVLMMMRGRYSV